MERWRFGYFANISKGYFLEFIVCSHLVFWLLAKNPLVEKRIREEIQQQLNLKVDENLNFFSVQETRKLVYLHGALCETLRLFPSVAIEHKLPHDFGILPSAHHDSPNTRVVLSLYTMGRMESIWGKID